ncbi:prolyl 4-hydroxylase subunit alpha-2-like [Haematobia irritans]|uniref:prolyl 4-hydroxylase subunit alpha-2-like n=1 Tax=Haematobia irritans TaxID=7368 RepID=UPI003F4F6B70
MFTNIFYNLIISIVILFGHIQCEYYTSISGLEDLLTLESKHVITLKQHLVKLEQLKKELDDNLNEVSLEYDKGQNATYQYHEIANFQKIRRYVVDWKPLEKLAIDIRQINVYQKSKISNKNNEPMPNVEDLRGAAKGLSRLQHLYKLSTQDLSKGYLKGKKYSSDMTAFNCFILGKSLYESEEYQTASEWLFEALNKVEIMEKSKNNERKSLFPTLSKVEILQYLGLSLHKAGKSQLALTINSKWLQLDPENPKALENHKIFRDDLKRDRRRYRLKSPSKTSTITDWYEKVCNGELQQTSKDKSKLYCQYTNKNVAYYLLGPLKMELLNLDPFVGLYYDVLHDKEIDEIIQTSKDSLERSEIGDDDDPKTDDIRISKNSWLDLNEKTELVETIKRRLHDITELSPDSAEDMQVANYGIGGYYGLHYDFDENPNADDVEEGNRILTAMFYLNDVEMGGVTAFPILRLAVPPIKRALVVWYNLHKSGYPDFRTSHAGCPVLKGSKWIGNVWFDQVGQELHRPCGLHPDEDISKPYISLGLD